MSRFGHQRNASPSPTCKPVRQKLQFTSSDGEDEPIDDANNSIGGESGFTELDSSGAVRQEAGSALDQSAEDVDLWDEQKLTFGSPAHLQSPEPLFANCSPSPRKASSRLFGGSPSPVRTYGQDEGDQSSSPIPDCPETPPHKTFRKLRLFDTPHTPKVSLCPCTCTTALFQPCYLGLNSSSVFPMSRLPQGGHFEPLK